MTNERTKANRTYRRDILYSISLQYCQMISQENLTEKELEEVKALIAKILKLRSNFISVDSELS